MGKTSISLMNPALSKTVLATVSENILLNRISFPPRSRASLTYPQQCPRMKYRGRGRSNMCGRRGASRFRQAGPPHVTWRYFPQTLHVVVCEVWRAWRVIGDSFAAAGCCTGHGVSAAAVCGTFQRFDLREKIQNKTNSLLNRFWSSQAKLTLLNR